MKTKRMSYFYLKALLLSTVILGIFQINLAHAARELDSVNLRIKANIVTPTCTVSNDSKNKFVVLGDWPSKRFWQAGRTTSLKYFALNLEDCGVSTNARIRFLSPPVANNPTLFALNPGANTASNIGIAILDRAKKAMMPNVFSQPILLDANKKINTLEFYAQYVSTGTPVKPGIANSDITFEMQYE